MERQKEGEFERERVRQSSRERSRISTVLDKSSNEFEPPPSFCNAGRLGCGVAVVGGGLESRLEVGHT
jgi:hypothetical protein